MRIAIMIAIIRNSAAIIL